MSEKNPEDVEYEDSIADSVRWLGYDWGTHRYHASDYYDALYEFAEWFVEQGLAYVDSQTADEVRATRGTLTQPGKAGPYRDRSVAENLDLLRRMRAGEFPDGAHVLRLKIDMASPNLNLRDPPIYRIRHANHHRTGDRWCIYPLYDYTHCISDALERVTHSICTLEFQDHRPLYDWIIAKLADGGRLSLEDVHDPLAFVDDGVYQLVKGQQTKGIDTKNFSPTYRALEGYDIEKLYVEKESLDILKRLKRAEHMP